MMSGINSGGSMNRRTFLTGTGLGTAAFLSLGRQASAAEWTAQEKANVATVNDFIAARVRLRNAHASIDEWNATMAKFAIEDVMFTVHAVGNFVPQAKIPSGLGPYTKIEMKIGDTFAKGPIVMHERTDFMSFANRPDSTGRFVGVYALKDGKIHEWLEYSF
jgi:limonene-1,2-epoxide hydrolase